jgi:hypothetical protein
MSRILNFNDGFETTTPSTVEVLNADEIVVTPSGNISSTDVQAALVELQGDINTSNSNILLRETIVNVDDKINTSSLNDRAYADSADDNHRNTVDGIHGINGSVVGTYDTQTLTNKDIDGGTASNTLRITVPKNTKTNLDNLTRKEGTIVFDTVGKSLHLDNGTTLKQVVEADSSGRVGIGTASPNSSSLLDITSTTKGFLQPRMTTTQRNAISSPVAGLSVYDTTLSAPYYYDGFSWQIISGTPIVARAVDTSGQSIPTGSTTIVNFNTLTFDTTGYITTGASWKFQNLGSTTAIFDVSAQLNLASATGGGSLIIYIYKNGSQYSTNYTLTGGAAPYAVNISDGVQLAPNDYIDIRVLQNAGVSRSLVASASYVYISKSK